MSAVIVSVRIGGLLITHHRCISGVWSSGEDLHFFLIVGSQTDLVGARVCRDEWFPRLPKRVGEGVADEGGHFVLRRLRAGQFDMCLRQPQGTLLARCLAIVKTGEKSAFDDVQPDAEIDRRLMIQISECGRAHVASRGGPFWDFMDRALTWDARRLREGPIRPYGAQA
jgi:hypothetical protein